MVVNGCLGFNQENTLGGMKLWCIWKILDLKKM
jgi:hypothetical protein